MVVGDAATLLEDNVSAIFLADTELLAIEASISVIRVKRDVSLICKREATSLISIESRSMS